MALVWCLTLVRVRETLKVRRMESLALGSRIYTMIIWCWSFCVPVRYHIWLVPRRRIVFFTEQGGVGWRVNTFFECGRMVGYEWYHIHLREHT